jgi:hypothetical protein
MSIPPNIASQAEYAGSIPVIGSTITAVGEALPDPPID